MQTLIEKLLSTTEEGKRELARQQLLVSVSDQVWDVLEQEQVSSVELANRLHTSASNVSQLLSGQRNMTLGTLSDVAYHLGYQARVHLRKEGCGAAVLPARWTLHKTAVKHVDAPANAGLVDKHEYETEALSWKAAVNQPSANASKSAAA